VLSTVSLSSLVVGSRENGGFVGDSLALSLPTIPPRPHGPHQARSLLDFRHLASRIADGGCTNLVIPKAAVERRALGNKIVQPPSIAAVQVSRQSTHSE
jgi:hypothetical protein